MPDEKQTKVLSVSRCFVKGRNRLLLVLKRSPYDANNAGKWEVPGGKVDGEDLIHALEREVAEETGLQVELTHPAALIDCYIIENGKYAGMIYEAHFSTTRVIGGNFALSEEHVDFAWVGFDKMLSYDLTKQVRKAAFILRKQLV